MTAAAVTALAVAGCGSGDSAGSANPGSGSADPASGEGVASAIGTSLSCEAEPTQDELLAYEVPEADSAYDITLMQVSTAGYYYQAIDAGADKAAAEAGVKLTHLSADGYASPGLQLQQVQDAIARGTDAIVMAPSDIKGSVPVVEAATAAGIPVVNVSSEVASDDVTMVMQDDYAFGQIAADRVAEVLGEEGGNGILIAGPANATWSQRRTAGFQDRVKAEYPNIKIAAAPTQLVDPAAGLRSFEDALQANPDIDWIFSVHYFILPPASLPENIRGKVPYVTGGYEPDSVDALEKGWLDSVFGLSPTWMGRLGVGYAVSLLNGDDVSKVTCAPVPLFTVDEIGTPFADAELISSLED